ncbi:MAG: hypothetical protein HY077_09935 [Elusimicrobia bacterium]|nr:hypothetical protein [Elusimicrobiota bacterium]
MNAEPLIPYLTQAILLWERVMADPSAGPAISALLFLTGMSGAFWFISKLLGILALQVHDILHEDFAALFALSYNTVLASLFGGVMGLAVFRKGEGPFLLAWQAAGFVFVYMVLSANYANSRGEVDPHTGGGYAGGIAAYFLVCLFPHWLSAHPVLVRAHEAVTWTVHSPAGKIMLAVSVIQGVLYGLRAVRGWFFWKSVKIGKKRFFFSYAC